MPCTCSVAVNLPSCFEHYFDYLKEVKLGLQEEIDRGRKTIRSESMAMSIGELANLYTNRELIIRPAFQRLFRWNVYQKSRLIESVFLGIPLPSLFVMQNDEGIWEIIDGLQRCSTLFEFMGILRNEESGEIYPPSTLLGTKYLPSLGGMVFEGESKVDSLTPSQRITFKRSKLDIRILLPESDEKAKYELFDRLNSGGQQATAQEVRNVQLLLTSPDALDWVQSIAKDGSFENIVSLSDVKSEQQYDLDLVCRVVAISNSAEDELKSMGSVDEFITMKMQELMSDSSFNRELEKSRLFEMFSLLEDIMGPDAFRKHEAPEGVAKGGFSVSAFETITSGILANLDLWRDCGGDLRRKIQSIWAEDEFLRNTKAGTRGTTRIANVVPWARSYFSQG